MQRIFSFPLNHWNKIPNDLVVCFTVFVCACLCSEMHLLSICMLLLVCLLIALIDHYLMAS